MTATHESVADDVQELDQITKRFTRVMLLIKGLIVLMVLWLIARALSPEKLRQSVDSAQAIIMTFALILLAIVHHYSLRRTQVQDIERIRYLALHDGLTGVYNLRFLNQTVDQEIKRSKRFGHSFALLYIDLDGFKRINDTFGHAVGDKVLIEVSRLLSKASRVTDMVGRVASVIGRIGGDEFLVLMPETDAAGGKHLAQRFIHKIADLRVDVGDGQLADGLGASIGIVSYPHDGEERKELVEKADQAMYRAKQSGGNCYADAEGVVVKPLAGEQA